MHIRKTIMVAMAGLALAVPGFAQSASGGAPAPAGAYVSFKMDKFVAELDKDNDGKVSKAEWKAAGLHESNFDFLDSSKSGYLTKAQLEQTKLPSGMDLNKDGVLTVANMIAYDNAQAGGAQK